MGRVEGVMNTDGQSGGGKEVMNTDGQSGGGDES